MARLFRKSRGKKPGLQPGSLIFTGDQKSERIRIRVLDYDEVRFEEREASSIEECFTFRDTATVTWINIDGLHQPEIVEKIGAHYNIHSLVLEDILHTDQRPKIEEHEDFIFVVAKMLSYGEGGNGIRAEQMSLILGPNFVITFQERVGDYFDPVRDRIRNTRWRQRKLGSDYLANALIDAVVDHYFTVLEQIGERMETLEAELMKNQRPAHQEDILNLKRELLNIRKAGWPMREVVAGLLNEKETSLIRESTLIYLRDVYDHITRVNETIEIYREMLTGIHELYLSGLSNRMNEVMKVLTIIATIFIPLTFIAGVYGMNFRYMPELEWRYGYFSILGIMGVTVAWMFVYFKRKKWM